MIDNSKEYILCAAIHFKDGIERFNQVKNIKSGIVVTGRRHSDCYTIAIAIDKIMISIDHVQGFLTSKNRFLNREEAYELAVKCEQIKEDSGPRTLISENLY